MADLVGRTFGNYRLEALLGRGGMGEVYRARHLRLTNRLAAVKVLPASLAAEPDFLQRFEHEANAAAALDHPAILPLWDYGEQDGQPYLAMPLVSGGTLKDLLEWHGPFTLTEAEGYIAPIAEALDYAHARGIIHRDVKPGNILLREDGRPLLADFGIAKAIATGQGEGITRTGAGIGTPEYMAPEQIEGRAEPRSDLYALGVVLYQLLTGRVPHDGSTPYEIASKQLYSQPVPARQFRPDLPIAIEQVLTTALAKDPAARYASGRAFIAAYQRACQGSGSAGAGATVAAPIHDRRTTPLVVGPSKTTPLPFDSPPPPSPARSITVTATGPAPAMIPRPPVTPMVAPRRAARWPLAVAGGAIVILVLGIGGVGLYAALFNNTPTPTPAAAPNLAATAAAATATAASAQGAAANATATAVAAGAIAKTATQQGTTAQGATATAAAQQATASANSAAATAGAVASATAAVGAQQTATAATNANATATIVGNATATVAGNATATARANGAQTATAAARPTASPTRAPTATAAPPTVTPTAPPTVTPTRVPTATPTTAPTATKPPASNWGPALLPLADGKPYTDTQRGFSLLVPNNWKQSSSTDSDVAFASADGKASFSVILGSIAANMTIDSYNQLIEQQLRNDFPTFTQVSLDKVLVDNHQAYRRVVRATSQGQTIQFALVYFLDRTNSHNLTFATLPESFAALAPTFDGIAGSYKVAK